MINKNYLIMGTLLFLMGFILIDLSFIEAREFNDPIVAGDETPVFSDGGENVLKNKIEPIVKSLELPTFVKPKKYTVKKENLGDIKVTVKRDLQDRIIEVYGTYPTGNDINDR